MQAVSIFELGSKKSQQQQFPTEVWAFQSDTGGWQRLCAGGPAPAGHVAAVDHDSQRLLLCFGVRRSALGSQKISDWVGAETIKVVLVAHETKASTVGEREHILALFNTFHVRKAK